MRIERQEQVEFVHRREQDAVQMEEQAKRQIVDTDLKASVFSGSLGLNKKITSSR